MSDSRVEISEYKGHPVISLITIDGMGVERKFTFGKKKAELIVKHFEDIQLFTKEEE